MFIALLRVYNLLKLGGKVFLKFISFDPVISLLEIYPKKVSKKNKIIIQKCIVVHYS